MSKSAPYPGHARALLVLGLPLIGGHLAQHAIQVTDTLMLGWYDVTALAAVVLAGTLWFIVFVVGAGFALAIVPMVATASEQPDADTQIRRVTRMGLWISAIYAVLALVPMLRAGPLLNALGQEPEVAALAADYLAIAGWGLIPALGVMVLKSYLSALERTRVVLWVTALAAAVNAGVNYLLIFGNFGFPELGVRGAAIASVTVQVVSLAGLVIYALRAFPEHSLFVRLWRPDWAAFGNVFRLGWPISLTNLSEVGLFGASAVLVGWFGTIPLAAHGIALELAATTFFVHLGLSNASTILTGKALGRRDFSGLRHAGVTAIALSAMIAVVFTIAYIVWPDALLSLFIDPEDPRKPEILRVGAGLLVMAALFQMADAMQVMAHGLLRGVQDTRVPMLLSALAYWVIGLSSGYVLGFPMGFGAVGVWAGLVLGLVVAAGLLMARFWLRTLPSLSAAPRGSLAA